MSSDRDPTGQPPRESFEFIEQQLTPAERCFAALIDLADTQDDWPHLYRAKLFYEAYTGAVAPDDLYTMIDTHLPDSEGDGQVKRELPLLNPGTEVVARITVDLRSASADIRKTSYLDFLRFGDQLQLAAKDWFFVDGSREPRYVRTLGDDELVALSEDAVSTMRTIIETDAERMKLGTLKEETGPDGLRRFHVGDILSVITGQLVSPRGPKGVYDFLRYMTNDLPYETQVPRFLAECAPYLREQFDAVLEPFYRLPDGEMTEIEVLRWLADITKCIGSSLLKVQPIGEANHAFIDPMTERQLDYGPKTTEEELTMFYPSDPEPDRND